MLACSFSRCAFTLGTQLLPRRHRSARHGISMFRVRRPSSPTHLMSLGNMSLVVHHLGADCRGGTPPQQKQLPWSYASRGEERRLIAFWMMAILGHHDRFTFLFAISVIRCVRLYSKLGEKTTDPDAALPYFLPFATSLLAFNGKAVSFQVRKSFCIYFLPESPFLEMKTRLGMNKMVC